MFVPASLKALVRTVTVLVKEQLWSEEGKNEIQLLQSVWN